MISDSLSSDLTHGAVQLARTCCGSYTVDPPKNEAPAPPDVSSRTTTARADDPAGKDFGNWRPGSVTKTVIGDDNGDGARDPGEGGLAGIALFADLDGNGVRFARCTRRRSPANGPVTYSRMR